MPKILQMEFQPVFMAGHAIRKKDNSFWTNRVRPSVVPRINPSCTICGFIALENRGLIHADEVWSFPGPPRVLLSEIRPLCVYCHEAKDYENLLVRIRKGTAGAVRDKIILEHYCRINNCSEERFRTDYGIALAKKQRLEATYGNNCTVEIDYGKWSRPEKFPCLTALQRKTVRAMYVKEAPLEYDKEGKPIGRCIWDREEPILVGDRELKTFQSAVRYLQSLTPADRLRIIKEMQEFEEFENEDDCFEWVQDHN